MSIVSRISRPEIDLHTDYRPERATTFSITIRGGLPATITSVREATL